MSDMRDPDLSQRYRAASAETPPAALGDALRAAAAQASASVPFVQRRKWGAPLALAASVVLGLGIVLRVAVERPDMRPVAEAPAPASAPVPASAPAPAPAADPPGQVAQAADVMAKRTVPGKTVDNADKRQSSPFIAPDRVVVGEMRSSKADTALNTADRARHAVTPAAPAATGESRMSTAPPIASGAISEPRVARDEMKAVQGAAATPGPAAAAPPPPLPSLAAQAPPPAPAPARETGIAAQRAGAAALPAPKPAEPRESVARADAPRAKLESHADHAPASVVAEENALSPADWVKRIVELRRSGRAAEADASLKRLIARYPDFRVPEEARAH
jgi:hypothetical protein